jgi:hypothetical protein
VDVRKKLLAALADGDIARGQCDRCGGEGDPLLSACGPGMARIAGWRCYRCRHWPADGFYVYVIELSQRAGPRAVYVGQSALYPTERFAQHLTAYKSSAVVKRFGKRLRPDLFGHRNPLRSRQEAEEAEAQLAATLRRQGYKVFGGH